MSTVNCYLRVGSFIVLAVLVGTFLLDTPKKIYLMFFCFVVLVGTDSKCLAVGTIKNVYCLLSGLVLFFYLVWRVETPLKNVCLLSGLVLFFIWFGGYYRHPQQM